MPVTLQVDSFGVANSNKKHGQLVRLPNDFQPEKYAVLCGRGSKCTKSLGNKRLKQMVNENLTAYSMANNKVDKSTIVTNIIDNVKRFAPSGAFVKYEAGFWWEVEDAFAREKIGCMFRDSLHTQYRSSTKAKLARKRRAMAGSDDGSRSSSYKALTPSTPTSMCVVMQEQQRPAVVDPLDSSAHSAGVTSQSSHCSQQREQGRMSNSAIPAATIMSSYMGSTTTSNNEWLGLQKPHLRCDPQAVSNTMMYQQVDCRSNFLRSFPYYTPSSSVPWSSSSPRNANVGLSSLNNSNHESNNNYSLARVLDDATELLSMDAAARRHHDPSANGGVDGDLPDDISDMFAGDHHDFPL